MNSDMICWIDLETSGNTDNDEIIEIGACLTDTVEFEVLAEFQTNVQPSQEAFDSIWKAPIVVQMHTANGLIEELRRNVAPNIQMADAMFNGWLNREYSTSKEHLPLGGSGVSHFDRKFISKYMPLTDKRLTYWAYDVGTVRRTFQLVGQTTWRAEESKTHRALDDILLHVDEYKYYAHKIRDMK